jgi:hypothetical protein
MNPGFASDRQPPSIVGFRWIEPPPPVAAPRQSAANFERSLPLSTFQLSFPTTQARPPKSLTLSRPLRSVPHRLPPHRRGSHRPVQLALRPPHRRHLHPPHRGHRRRPQYPGSHRRHPVAVSAGSASTGTKARPPATPGPQPRRLPAPTSKVPTRRNLPRRVQELRDRGLAYERRRRHPLPHDPRPHRHSRPDHRRCPTRP